MVTKAQLLLAQNTPDVANADTVEDYSDEDVRSSPMPTTASVARSGVRSVGVYKLTPTGCQRVMVAAHSLAQVLRDGYSPVCFDCGTDTCPGGINDCPGRPPKKFRVCPVESCRKRIYDPKPTGKFKEDEFSNAGRVAARDDANAIDDGAYDTSTPETRTRAMLDMHIIGYHRDRAMELGLKAPELPGVTGGVQ